MASMTLHQITGWLVKAGYRSNASYLNDIAWDPERVAKHALDLAEEIEGRVPEEDAGLPACLRTWAEETPFRVATAPAEVCPDTGICGNFTQPTYNCPDGCRWWTTDPRDMTHRCLEG